MFYSTEWYGNYVEEAVMTYWQYYTKRTEQNNEQSQSA